MKKCIKALALAVVLAVMPVAAFAAPSPTVPTVTRPSGGGSSGGGGGGSSTKNVSSTGTVVAGTGTVTASGAASEVIVAADGTKLSVTGSATVNGITSALVSNNSNVSAAVGEAKTAGLPAGAVETINALNNGSLASVPGVDVSGKAAYGATVALRAEAGNQAATLYVSTLPESGVVQILFYNNATGQWSIISASVDAATKTVNFVVPYSGTAIVIG